MRLFSSAVHAYACEFPLGEPERKLLEASRLALPRELLGVSAYRRDEFLAGRHCARQALLAGGEDCREVGVGPNRQPAWPAGWVGSITHTRGRAAAAVARASELRGLGIDSERVMDAEQARKLRARLVTEGEWAAYLADPALRQAWTEAEFVTLAFSTKESVYKCLRPLTDRFFGFHSAEVAAVSSEGTARVRLTEDVGGGFVAGFELEARFAREGIRIDTAVELTARLR